MLRYRGRPGLPGRGSQAESTPALTDRGIVISGQSNGQNLYTYGETQFMAVFDEAYPASTNTLIDGATSGSALIDTNAGDTNWWYKPSDGTYGAAWDTFETAVGAYAGTMVAILWDQGEADLEVSANGTKRAEYKSGLVTLFTHMRDLVGNVPVFICPIGRRGDLAVTNLGYQTIREIQKELADEYAWIYLLPEKFTEGDDAGAHLDQAGYENYAPKAARKIMDVLGVNYAGVDGPEITGWSRNGTTVTVTLAHDGGTDFTPTTAIEGFKFFDGDTDTEITISAAVRTNATTITLTLADEPTTGNEMFYYGWNPMNGVDNTKLVLDNMADPMPLRSFGDIIDTLPSGLSFTDVADAVVSTQYTANATVTGFDGTLTAEVTSGAAEIRKNSTGTWGATVDVVSGDTINARNTSSGSDGTGVNATIVCGAASDTWTITTEAVGGDGSMQDTVASCVFDLDARIIDSYDGTSQYWRNLVTAPADGQVQGDYDFTLGNTSSAANDDPLFSGTAGTPTGKFTYSSVGAADFFQAIMQTPLFRDMHKSSGGSDHGFSGELKFIQNEQTQVYFATSNTSTAEGLRITANASEKLQLIQRHNGGTNASFTSDDTLVNNTTYAFVITHSHSTHTTKCLIEGGSIDSKTHTFGSSTTNANDVPAIGAEADGGVQCADGTEFISFQAYNAFLSDGDMSAALAAIIARRT